MPSNYYQLLPLSDPDPHAGERAYKETDASGNRKDAQAATNSDDAHAPSSRRSAALRTVRILGAISLAGIVIGALCCWSAGGLENALRWPERLVGSGSPSSGKGAALSALGQHHERFDMGLGIADVTGPIVEINQMGYAALPQTNTGLHIRLRARSFIVGDPRSDSRISANTTRPQVSPVKVADGLADRWVFINADICMGDSALRRAIVERIAELYPGVYGERNIALVGTHSHAGPGGYLNALLPTLTSMGVVRQSFDAIVDGTVRSVIRAHDDFERSRSATGRKGAGSLRFGATQLPDAHIQRSPFSYNLNPQEERDQYDADIENEFALLRFDLAAENAEASPKELAEITEDSQTRGFLSWYAVHGTSLYENNTLTSADNKGLAALMVETEQEPDKLPGQNAFIAGFSQSSVGDTSPNTQGAWCDDGSPCDYQHSTCPNSGGKDRVQLCHGRGPAWGDFAALENSPTGSWDWASNERVARMQADAASEVVGRPAAELEKLSGPVKAVKMNVDMSKYTVYRKDGTRVHTCPAALGYGFAGGTTDGPGAFDFVQGKNDTEHRNPFWEVVKRFVKNPSQENKDCQAPKPILLDVGEMHRPYDWSPSVVETQILRAGQLFILIVPGEFTTMAGRRIKAAVAASAREHGLLPEGQEPIVQISGPANTYGHYVTTREEYTAQRYEGASTLFGPHTLEAYIDIFANRLVPSMKEGARDLPNGPMAKINIENAYHFKTGVVYDNPPLGHKFGDVLVQPLLSYPTSSNVSVEFVGANPRNDLRAEDTFIEVQRYADWGEWAIERTDGHHSTTLRWTKTNSATGSSKVEIGWNIEPNTKPGLYRIVYKGNHKAPFTGKISDFVAISNEFYVT